MKKKLIAIALAAATTLSVPMSVSAVWQKDTAGNWQWSESGHLQTGWKQIGGKWYHFNQNGIMNIGWFNDNGTWYYLDNSGAMKTGWLLDKGTWYYCQSNGAMLTGLHTIGNVQYYFYPYGGMAVNTVVDGYKIDNSGAATKVEYYRYSDIPTYTSLFGDASLSQEVTYNDGHTMGMKYKYDYSATKADEYQNFIQGLGFELLESQTYENGGYGRSYTKGNEAILVLYHNFGSNIPESFSIEILVSGYER